MSKTTARKKTGIVDTMKKYQFMFEELVKRDFKQRYKRSILGMAWSILSPLMTLLVMRVIFTEFLGKDIPHYTIYLFSGNIVMSYFRESTRNGMRSLTSNAKIFTKINVPKYLFLLSKNVSALVNFGLTLIVYFAFCGIDHIRFTPKMFLLVYPSICLLITCIGIGAILSAMYVFFEDTSYLYDVVLTLLNYMSAIFYSVDSLSKNLQTAFLFNPVYVYIKYFRVIVIDGIIPSPAYHLLCLFFPVFYLSIGMMSNETAIKCEHVSIRYITGDFKSIGLKEYVIRRLTGNYHVKEFWADKDVTFTLNKGDMLGIIGSNGAGKSTLLKAVTGIMVPTGGKITVHGNIAALLELGSGFDGDMTVRENTYLRGALLGYTRKFLDEKYDEIIRFAELEDFQDYMFKQLSSGMKSRLAFSIACLVHPDILILDEVLSVGDGAFRKKSGAKMQEIIHGGVTAILVSHVMPQVRELCTKILWLDHGKQICFTDDVQHTCDAYEEFLARGKKAKVPRKQEQIDAYAEAYQKRLADQEAKKEKEKETGMYQTV